MTLLPAQGRLAEPPAPPRRTVPVPAPLPAPLAPPPAAGADGPVYARMVADWRAAGRTVPGEPDREWEQLLRPRTAWRGPRR
ncbi:hypothetical protein GXW83_06675 [Streptacidiphilus sp. PB12-B1b]|nr:hypothetical protein GXW83_06675 [Streptacidiphilus sp. PB12-B1b]